MTPRFKDITGHTFTNLTAVRLAYFRKGGAYWECICKCGETTIARGTNLRNGHTISCGCQRVVKLRESILVDITGQRFSRLVAICEDGHNAQGGL